MKIRPGILAGVAATAFLATGALGWWALRPEAGEAGAPPGFLHGRVVTVEGEAYEGRLRFGGDEEAAWDDYFNGVRAGNPWADHAASAGRPDGGLAFEVLGVEIRLTRADTDLRRPFMVRFGDIARIDADGRDLDVTLKSGTVVHLDRYEADDFADGVRVWDRERGVVDLEERRVRSIELLPAPGPAGAGPARLHGTVRTAQGEFSGFLQWNREEGLVSDALDGRDADGDRVSVPFEAIRSIERHRGESARVTLRDGREVVLSGPGEIGGTSRGIYVNDPRYGRVLVSWRALEGVDLSPAGSVGGGPAYDDFPAGRPLAGTVTTRDGRRLSGRLVYDLDETDVVETLDAPLGGVDYTIPFELVAGIEPGAAGGRARVTLRSGEELALERSGDLGDGHGGVLVFTGGADRPEHVPWSGVERVELDAPPAAAGPDAPLTRS